MGNCTAGLFLGGISHGLCACDYAFPFSVQVFFELLHLFLYHAILGLGEMGKGTGSDGFGRGEPGIEPDRAGGGNT